MAKVSLPVLGLSPPPLATPMHSEEVSQFGTPYQDRNGPPSGTIAVQWAAFHNGVYFYMCKIKLLRTLLLADLTVANPCGPIQDVYQDGWGNRICAILTAAISADLVVVFTKGADVMTITIPSATAIGVEVVQDITGLQFTKGETLIPQITVSDGTVNDAYIVELTVEWNLVQSEQVTGE